MMGVRSVQLAAVLLVVTACVMEAVGPPPPPIKAGLWQTKMATLDANGKEVPMAPPSSFANMPPERRAQMEAMMKARGLTMPDPSGAVKICMTKEMFDNGRWQQLSAETGCTTNYSGTSGSTWKWHTVCPALKSESDGEVVFASGESYHSKVTTTSNMSGTPKTTTRVMESKWLGASCGDIKPLTIPEPPKR